MKLWHIIIVALIAFTVGALYPAPVALVRSKIGI